MNHIHRRITIIKSRFSLARSVKKIYEIDDGFGTFIADDLFWGNMQNWCKLKQCWMYRASLKSSCTVNCKKRKNTNHRIEEQYHRWAVLMLTYGSVQNLVNCPCTVCLNSGWRAGALNVCYRSQPHIIISIITVKLVKMSSYNFNTTRFDSDLCASS